MFLTFRSINFQFVGSLSDKLFHEILAHNPFPCLESVSLDQCHRWEGDWNIVYNYNSGVPRFGPDLLFSLLNLAGPLSSLHCWSCGNITASARDQVPVRSYFYLLKCSNIPQVAEFISNNFLDVNFQWTGVQEEAEEDNDFLNEEDDLQNLLLPLIGVNVLQNVE